MPPAASESATALETLSEQLADAVEQSAQSVVAVHARPRIGSSGIHWQPGVIVTAAHTVKRDEEITLTLPTGRTVPASLAGRDTGTDLAVLRAEASSLPTARVAAEASLKVGHFVLAVGRTGPGGPSASLGVVSALGGEWRTYRGNQIDQLIQLDMTIHYGFSGSPLVDSAGSVVGLNTSGLSRGAPLTLPAAMVSRVAGQLLERGHVARGYLGVAMQPVRLSAGFRSRANLDQAFGLVVLGVEPDGPAEHGGVLVGDVLVRVAGKPVSDTNDVQAALGTDSIGGQLNLSVVRGGSPLELVVGIGQRPPRRP